jgi:uncharacterized protein YbbK (DUF523 family)
MNDAKRPVLVSACLAGRACRYDGTAAPHPEVERLAAQGLAVVVCPEEMGGLTTPREPCEIMDGRVVCPSGRDVTSEFQAGAAECLALARERGCTRAILKARSPSCGSGRIYDGTFGKRLIPGDGVLAALLKANGIAVVSDLEL